MRHAWFAAAGILAAALVASAAPAQEPVKVKGDVKDGKLTVKDTGEKVKVKESGSSYKLKETGGKFKVKETRSGDKVKGTSVKIRSAKAGEEAEEAPARTASPASATR